MLGKLDFVIALRALGAAEKSNNYNSNSDQQQGTYEGCHIGKSSQDVILTFAERRTRRAAERRVEPVDDDHSERRTDDDDQRSEDRLEPELAAVRTGERNFKSLVEVELVDLLEGEVELFSEPLVRRLDVRPEGGEECHWMHCMRWYLARCLKTRRRFTAGSGR